MVCSEFSFCSFCSIVLMNSWVIVCFCLVFNRLFLVRAGVIVDVPGCVDVEWNRESGSNNEFIEVDDKVDISSSWGLSVYSHLLFALFAFGVIVAVYPP